MEVKKRLDNDSDFNSFVWMYPEGNQTVKPAQKNFIKYVRNNITGNMMFSNSPGPMQLVDDIRIVMMKQDAKVYDSKDTDIFFIFNEQDEQEARIITDKLSLEYPVEIMNIMPDSEDQYRGISSQQIPRSKLAVVYFKYAADWALPFIKQIWKEVGGASSPTPLFLVGDDDPKTNMARNFKAPKVVSSIIPKETIDGVRTRQMRRQDIFIYPDYMDGWFNRPYNGDAFFNYLTQNQLLSKIYRTSKDLEMLHLWIAKAYEVFPPNNRGAYGELFPVNVNYFNYYPLPDSVINTLLKFVERHPRGADFDKNLPRIILANRALARGDSVQGMNYFNSIDIKNIQRSVNRYEYIEKNFFLNQLKDLGVNLAVLGHHREAIEVTESFTVDFQKIFSYMDMAKQVYKKDTSAMTFVYLDSAFALNKRIDYNSALVDGRYNLVFVLAGIGGRDMNIRAREIMRNFDLDAKRAGTLLMVWGSAEEGNYYQAITSVSSTFTERDELFSRELILLEECKRRESDASSQQWKVMDEYYKSDREFIYYLNNL